MGLCHACHKYECSCRADHLPSLTKIEVEGKTHRLVFCIGLLESCFREPSPHWLSFDPLHYFGGP